MLRNFVSYFVRTAFPQKYWQRRFERLCAIHPEPEMMLARHLSDKSKTFVDVGADMGAYTAHLVSVSKDCIFFEPRLNRWTELNEMFSALDLPVRAERVALSDTGGVAKLRILDKDQGRSTIEAENKLDDPDGSPKSEVSVPLKTLDDYDISSAGLIKIDVEGHELSVLRGARATIEKSRPVILVEIEARHKSNAVSGVTSFLAGFGYEGFFILDGRLRPISAFDEAVHQNPENISGWRDQWKRSGTYVNNFIFVQANERARLDQAFAAAFTGQAAA